MQTPPLNKHADISRIARELEFGMSLNLHSFYVCEKQRKDCTYKYVEAHLSFVISTIILCAGTLLQNFFKAYTIAKTGEKYCLFHYLIKIFLTSAYKNNNKNSQMVGNM